jgi:small-conductance mechanosensitive channel
MAESRMRLPRRLAAIALATLVAACAWASSATAQPAASPPPEVRQLLDLLQNPNVRAWLDQRPSAPERPAEAAPAPPTTQLSELAETRISLVRQHLRRLLDAVPRLPEEIGRAFGKIRTEFRERGHAPIMLLVVFFVALGFGLEYAARYVTRRTRARIAAMPGDTARHKLAAVGARFLDSLMLIAVFTAGSIGAFLLFEWPPLLRQIALSYLVAALILRSALVLGRLLFATDLRDPATSERFRIVAVPAGEASFWQWRIAVVVGVFAFGLATRGLLAPLGFTADVARVVADGFALALLVVALEIVWRKPVADATLSAGRGRVLVVRWMLTALMVVTWLLLVAGLTGTFWLIVVVALLPPIIGVAQRSITRLLHVGEGEAVSKSVHAVCLERGVRLVLIVGAAAWLAHVWNIDLIALTDRDTLATRALRALLTSVLILLVADFLWQLVKTLVDSELAANRAVTASAGTDDAVRQARLRTLLPIFRNTFFIVLAVMSALMVLSALGVEIGPLIAGAGVVGVAVGFGSQTLVRDIFSGIFYLLDDAFRVGEYIQSGTYKGYVESFSLRSIKLRHHRGYVYTVPFGQLGAVQNMSRDWVIDKFSVNVTYDTDLEAMRKLVKKVGKDIAEDPEMGPNIIEPMKMQGVQKFGDYAIEVRIKMMTKPQEQFVIRRKSLARLKLAFDAAGIKFAFPTVQVSGSEDGAAAAHEALGRDADAEAAPRRAAG